MLYSWELIILMLYFWAMSIGIVLCFWFVVVSIEPVFFLFWFRLITCFFLLFFQGGRGLRIIYLLEEGVSFSLFFSWVFTGSVNFLTGMALVKLRIPPFHFWFIKAIEEQGGRAFLWGITGHKVPIVIFWIVFISRVITPLMVGVIVIRARAILLQQRMLRVLIISSSIFILPLIVVLSFSLRVIRGFLLYLFSIVWCFFWSRNFVEGSLWWFVVAGLPPFLGFQIKWLLVEMIWGAWGFIFLFVSILVFWVYLRIIIQVKEITRLSAYTSSWVRVSALIPVW